MSIIARLLQERLKEVDHAIDLHSTQADIRLAEVTDIHKRMEPLFKEREELRDAILKTLSEQLEL